MAVKRWSLSQQLSLGAFILIMLVMTAFITVVGYQSRNVLIAQAEVTQDSQISVLASQLETIYRLIIDNTQMLASIFAELYSDPLVFDSSQTVLIGDYDSPRVTHRGEQVNLNFNHVDGFARMTGGNATVFIRYQDDFLRVTTSLKNREGKRAVGTLLGKSHPGYQQLIRGEVYLGEAKLFGTDYMTKYSPVMDANRRVVAILYVGFPISKLLKQLRESLLAIRFGDSGYASLVNTQPGKHQGKLIVHATAQGKKLAQAYPLDNGSGSVLTPILNRVAGAFELREPNKGLQARVSFSRAGNSPWSVFAISYRNEYTQQVTPLMWLLIGLAVVAVVMLVVALGYFLRRSLLPLQEVTGVLEQVGQGDLTCRFEHQVDADSHNEVESLKLSTTRMLSNFSDVINKVSLSGDEITLASSQLSRSSEDMSQMAALSDKATTDVSVSITKMAASIEHVGNNVSKASEEATLTTQLADEGYQVVNEVMTAIGQLKQEFGQATDAITRLEQDSNDIDNVVEVINSVAEQTNLLALNAAIEAARAGEQGKGFAVVADEVRQLAQRVQDSTKEIQQVVEKLHNNAKQASTRMEAGEKQVKGSVDSAAQAGEMLVKIRDAAQQVKARMAEVADTTAQQSCAAEQISRSSLSLEQSAGQTTKAVEGTSQASHKMLDQANELQSQVSRFQVN